MKIFEVEGFTFDLKNGYKQKEGNKTFVYECDEDFDNIESILVGETTANSLTNEDGSLYEYNTTVMRLYDIVEGKLIFNREF